MTALYQRVKTGQVNFGAYFAQIVAAMPAWASTALERLGLDDLSLLQAKVTAAITARGEALAGRAVDIGGNVLDLVIEFAIAMYLLFFLLRDGVELTRDIRAAIPLAPAAKERVLERFTTVIRATVKGNVLVAAAQGALGGLAFWFLGVHAADALGGHHGLPVAAAGGRRGADLGPGRALPARRRPGLARHRPDAVRRRSSSA